MEFHLGSLQAKFGLLLFLAIPFPPRFLVFFSFFLVWEKVRKFNRGDGALLLGHRGGQRESTGNIFVVVISGAILRKNIARGLFVHAANVSDFMFGLINGDNFHVY